MAQSKRELFERRKRRMRVRLSKISGGRKRLSVFRSNQNIYAQIIDDTKGVTLASASTLDSSLRKEVEKIKPKEAAAYVGKLVAERASSAGITEVVFDRGGYRYHGRVKALADAAREAGLQF